MTGNRRLVGILIAGSLVGCRPAGEAARFGPAETISAPTQVGTAPMFAVSPHATEAAAWVSAPNGGTDGRLYVSVAGRSPSEIRDPLGPIEPHGEAPPKLAYAPNGALYALYAVAKVVPGQRFPLAALRLVNSTDNGATWTAPVSVTDGSVFGSNNFHALHVAKDGTIYVSWLGSLPGVQGAAGHHASASGGSTTWLTRSTDNGKTWSPRVRVNMGESCPCCRTAIATTADGSLFMAWRQVYPGNIRDIVVARSNDRGATWSDPVRVHADDWKFDACPHAGPAMVADSAGTLHVTWWTGKEGMAGVYYAQSVDGARSFGPAVPLGTARFSRPAHVQLALGAAGRVVVAWDDGTRQVPSVVLRVSRDSGNTFDEAIPLSAPGRPATFPVLGIVGDSLTVAWSEEGLESAEAAAGSAPNMKDPTAVKGLTAVGAAQVMVRRGSLQ